MNEEVKISITDVIDEWKNDSTIDESNLNEEISRTSSLHSKYINYYIYFKDKLNKAETLYFRLGNVKRRYYRGECTKEELNNFGWVQFQGLKIKGISEMSTQLDFDTDMIKRKEEINSHKAAISALEYILKNITGRDYHLKTLFEYNKYINGA